MSDNATNPKVYIHEFIDIVGLNRANYIHHMTANWGPIGQAERDQLCFGVWPVIGSTGRWPEVVNMWELDGWEGIALGFSLEGSGKAGYDPSLEKWWAHAADFRRGGIDRLVVPAPWNRTIEELCADGVNGVCYAHELVAVTPGRAHDLLDRVQETGEGLVREFDWEPVGAFRTAMANDDECILIWAIPTWEAWTTFEYAADADSALAHWRRSLDDIVTGWDRVLMVDAPLCPLRTGRQPRVEDRVAWDAPQA
ncbi:MAG: hypothetical protein U5K30_06925 [Acidimicrobiales bacterium]|nr:hypothetical protein [Acidimicrobiales bacterium]